ncbi:glycosyltransferase family 2 protein [Leuconostoc mesenteroides]|uniref:glycosyltransferase family 2 protein n=1 Tax=Leuconostoc TaxID=1243 RepID=UPI0021C0CFB0|nr:glycosyltransferase family 2 protein [Leuconostoc mesenteroides]MCT8383257.1 glycosyltransferase family 2 protein [Leuconostoc mesenteroides]
MREKKITAIITTHSRPELFKRALISVLEQTITINQIIIVLNNVDPETLNIANVYKSKNNNIEIIQTDQYLSGAIIRNMAIKNSTGDYIALLDDDDYWLSTKIEKELLLAEQKNVGVIYTGLRRLTGSTTHSDVLPTLQGEVSEKIFSEIPTVTSAILFEKSILKQELFDEKLTHWQEYELLIRLSKVTNFAFVPEILTVIQDDNKTGKDRMTLQLDKWESAVSYIRTKHAERLESLPISISKKFEIQYLKDRISRKEQQKFGWWKSFSDAIQLVKISKNKNYILLLVPGMTITRFVHIKRVLK